MYDKGACRCAHRTLGFYPRTASYMHRFAWACRALYGMVDSVNDNLTRPSATGTETENPAEDPQTGPQAGADDFQQLTLEATVTGPGKRTEDHYERGAKLTIKGERGVFTYKHASVSKAGLVSLHLAGAGGSRAVRPDQVAPVRKKRYRREARSSALAPDRSADQRTIGADNHGEGGD